MARNDSTSGSFSRRVRVLLPEDDHARVDELRHALQPSDLAEFELIVVDDFEAALMRSATRELDVVLLSTQAFAGRGTQLLAQLVGRGVPHPVVAIVPEALPASPVDTPGVVEFIESSTASPEVLSRVLLHAVERRQLKSRLIAAESRANQRSLYDSLTGLANRALLLERIARAMRATKRGRSPGFALLFVDLDRFKNINDSLGHLAGDKILVEVAGRIRDVVHDGDTVARTGADEYMVLLAGINGEDDALAIAQRLKTAISLPYIVDDRELRLTTSVGACAFDERHSHALDVYRDSDSAVHAAKARGGDRVELFGAELRTLAVRRFDIENELPRAIEKREFEAHFQPIVELSSGRIVGAEALIRWNHPERGRISPLDFISVAEATGMIVPLGLLVLTEACVQAQACRQQLPEGAPFRISVNVSPIQFKDGIVSEQVRQALASSGLPPECLAVEITESLLIEDVASTTQILHQLRDTGVGVYLDDFGTGYSSLSYLVNLPLTIVKIDRAFVSEVTSREDCEKLARGIVSLAHSLELETTAEGIEEPEQIAALREMGCEFGQGFYYSKPLPGSEFLEFLINGQNKANAA